MNEILKVNYDNDRITVSARELHEFLEVGTSFKDWFPRMCEYGFNLGEDFNPLKFERIHQEGGRQVKREIKDYQLTIEMAKELAMIQRNEKGKQARQYFLEIEKRWNSPEYVMKRAREIANKKVEALMNENTEMKPKAFFADAVSASETSILVGELAKLIKQNGTDMGQKRLFERLRRDGYLMKSGSSKNMPTQKAMELGLMEIRERTVSNPDGTVFVTKTTKVTGKGQVYFVNKYCGKETYEKI